MAISLESISRGARMKAPKVVLYGTAGVGKTTVAAGAPNPIFLCTEDGIGSLNVAAFPLLRSWSDIMDALESLQNEDHDFKTVVIDSLDFAEPLLWDQVVREYQTSKGEKDIEDFGYGRGYIHAVQVARKLLDALDRLRDTKQMAIVLICHDEVVRHESPDHEGYDRYQLRLQKRLAHKVRDWSDCLLFANYRTHVVKDKGSFGNERARAVGKGDRVLYTEERPAFWAKNRYGLPAELDLSWSAFQNAVTASAQAAQAVNETTDNPTQELQKETA